MISLGLSAADDARFRSLLTSSHKVQIVTQILDLNHNRLADISNQFGGGQITMDATQDITRSASLTFFDPYRKIALDSSSPSDGALFLDRMIAVYYVVWSTDGTFRVPVPVFTGPVTKLDRDEEIINVECQGKEILGLDPVWNGRTFKKGAYKVGVIQAILSDIGETKFSLRRNNAARVTGDFAISSAQKPWTVAKQIAAGMGTQLFYDGRGVATTRVVPTSPLWSYRERGDVWSIVNRPPQVGYDLEGFSNTIVVKGATPKGRTAPLTYRLSIDRAHPLSPWNLGRAGKPRYVSREISDDSLATMAALQAVAKREVTRFANESVDVAFDALVVPQLEENDPYRLITDDFSTVASNRQMTLPLQVDAAASMGYLRSVKPNKATIRRRR